MKIYSAALTGITLLCSCGGGKYATIPKDELQDKIKGGWAGQIIGCTYGGPTEFKFKAAMIPDDYQIPWHDHYVEETMKNRAGLYDDVYMDICYVETIEKSGLDTPMETFSHNLAHGSYRLWHADQIARYLYLRGIPPPQTGHWMNNPHDDDIDFQIQSDFIGLMSPGMVNFAGDYCDRIGHIMNYGDGFYGGVYISALYAGAFVTDDIEELITMALGIIPAESRYHRCITNTIALWKKYPDDWKKTWMELETLHGADDIGCGYGANNDYNIDAALNSAYVVIGLLYGGGDFFKTMDISTRCGQDSDCNPATACGILGTMLGYSAIGEQWTRSTDIIMDTVFPFTESTLNEVCDMSYRHAVEVILRNGGSERGDKVKIAVQQPVVLPLEQSFTGMYPVERVHYDKQYKGEGFSVQFHGTGFILHGTMRQNKAPDDYTAWFDIYIDGQKAETIDMPCDFIHRRYDIYHQYDLPKGDHTVEVRWTNYQKPYTLLLRDLIYYTDDPSEMKEQKYRPADI